MNKAIIYKIGLLSICGGLCFSGLGMILPSEQEIIRISSPTNPPAVLRSELYPLVTNLCLNASSCPVADVEHAEFLIMTNVLLRVAETNFVCDAEFAVRSDLFEWIVAFNSIRENPSALLFCSDYIGTLSQVSTNSYVAELINSVEADIALDPKYGERKVGLVGRGWNKNWGPNRKQFEQKWRPILRYNFEMKRHREKVLRIFKSALSRLIRDKGNESIETLKPQIIQRAKLTTDEMKELFPQTQQE